MAETIRIKREHIRSVIRELLSEQQDGTFDPEIGTNIWPDETQESVISEDIKYVDGFFGPTAIDMKEAIRVALEHAESGNTGFSAQPNTIQGKARAEEWGRYFDEMASALSELYDKNP